MRYAHHGGATGVHTPVDMAEGNAGDWEAWAQGATATTSNDTTRKIVGNSSVKFVTDGGFDTYARYPGTSNALWDLRGSDVLTMSIYAENNTIGFQGGSPWIRLYDADGNFFQYQFYAGGNPYDLLNEARNTWQTYNIPLDANETVQDGWRRTSHGTPDLSSITASRSTPTPGTTASRFGLMASRSSHNRGFLVMPMETERSTSSTSIWFRPTGASRGRWATSTTMVASTSSISTRFRRIGVLHCRLAAREREPAAPTTRRRRILFP